MYLKQLGYVDDNIPTLYVLYPPSVDSNRLELAILNDIDLPFWTGDVFRHYMKKHHNCELIYTIDQLILRGQKCLHQLGLQPNQANIAFPLMQNYEVHRLMNNKNSPPSKDDNEDWMVVFQNGNLPVYITK